MGTAVVSSLCFQLDQEKPTHASLLPVGAGGTWLLCHQGGLSEPLTTQCAGRHTEQRLV